MVTLVDVWKKKKSCEYRSQLKESVSTASKKIELHVYNLKREFMDKRKCKMTLSLESSYDTNPLK